MAIPDECAELTPMSRSFFSDARRVGIRLLRDELGVALYFPTYRKRLIALRAAGDGLPQGSNPSADCGGWTFP
jgi:hypothetical protein